MIKIMIVEDDPMVMEINEKFISKLDFCKIVATAFSVEKAKQLMAQNEIDLVLLDVFLPDGKGIEFLKWMRREELDVDALLITADKSTKTVATAFQYGAIGYLVKPFKFGRLKETLQTYFEKQKLRERSEMTQEEIDALNSYQQRSKNLTTSSQITNVTYQKIVEYIGTKGSQGITAQEVANYLGISRVTARKYLERMEKSNILKLELVYGGIGRPKNVYQLNKIEE